MVVLVREREFGLWECLRWMHRGEREKAREGWTVAPLSMTLRIRIQVNFVQTQRRTEGPFNAEC